MKRRRLGQHYLIDREVVSRIVSLAEIRPTDHVLEIGTGKGALSQELVGLGASYTGYEVDRSNFEATASAVGESGARLVMGDAFEESPEFDVLVSSLPYSESATFVRWLSGLVFRRAIVLLQQDFVRKIMSPPGDRDYRGISAISQVSFKVREFEKVGRAAFSPQPRVSSVIASFEPRRRISREEAASILRLFSLRRRLVDSALAVTGVGSDVSFGRRRVYSLTPDEIHLLCLPRDQ